MPSEVEQFYKAIQAKMGGNIPWEALNPVRQQEIVHAVNIILFTCSQVGVKKDV